MRIKKEWRRKKRRREKYGEQEKEVVEMKERQEDRRA